jgi:hypothetical protein
VSSTIALLTFSSFTLFEILKFAHFDIFMLQKRAKQLTNSGIECRDLTFRLRMMGSRKATVLPDPVGAHANTSRPCTSTIKQLDEKT